MDVSLDAMNSILSNSDVRLGGPTEPRARRATPAQLLFFYTGPPLLMALPMGLYGAGLGAELPFAGSMLLWMSICLMSWLLSDICSRFFAQALRPWRSPVWVILVCGYLVNLAASSVYNPAVVAGLVASGLGTPTPVITQYFQVDRNLFDGHYLWMLFLRGFPGMLLWIVGNYIFEAMTGVVRFRRTRRIAFRPRDIAPTESTPRAAVATSAAALNAHSRPRFFERLERLKGLRVSDLLAIEAQDHYIQGHSARGKELIYYRFGEALGDLQSLDGLQIHRSAWVSRNGIERLEGAGRSLQVVLSSGEKLHVSQSNRSVLRAAGWAN